MQIKFKKKTGQLVFWPDNSLEEKSIEKIRIFFNDAFHTDRVWSKEQARCKKPLGIRVYLR